MIDLAYTVIAIGIAALFGLGYWSAIRHRDRMPRLSGEAEVLRLLLACGPLYIAELRRFGVEDAQEVVERLVFAGCLRDEPTDGGVLYALSASGLRRAKGQP